LTSICLDLPEARVETVDGVDHLIYSVRKRRFAYYLFDHHGDGEVALSCKAEPGLNEALVQSDPAAFFIPSYLGPRGWIAVRLDRDDVDWSEVADLVEASYRLIAPKTLVRALDMQRDGGAPSAEAKPGAR
jgi:predicted DNA-binding protein (MmcQ/YjbR family)